MTRRPPVRLATQKALYALSANRCAYPRCTVRLVESTTASASDGQIGRICHIYAASPGGPRGDGGLSRDQLNSLANLILLCPNHHAIVDSQPDTYSARLLIQWKATHESQQLSDTAATIATSAPLAFSFSVQLVDERITKELTDLLKSRFFHDRNTTANALVLARRLETGEYSLGTPATRSRALAWCARLLSADDLSAAQAYHQSSMDLLPCHESDVARAFLLSRTGNRDDALSALATVNTPASRSAALPILDHHDGPAKAVEWLTQAGLTLTDLDSDGRLFLLMYHLRLANWQPAEALVAHLTDEDRRNTPALRYLNGIVLLLTAVPEELKATVLHAVPFAARDFRLASGLDDMQARRDAREHFLVAAAAARDHNCEAAATDADEYALWLELKDPDRMEAGSDRLSSMLSGPGPRLRFVHLGLQFGCDLDTRAIEREIERTVALHGHITPDAARARFSLVLTHSTPTALAAHIGANRDVLMSVFDQKAIRLLQVEALARSNSYRAAQEHLEALRSEGLLDSSDETRIRHIFAESAGSDAVRGREEQYTRSGKLVDLMLLAKVLNTTGNWRGLCEYGARLFALTRSLEDAELLATALFNTENFGGLLTLLEDNRSLLKDSDRLRLLYCWALFETGQLLPSRSELQKVKETSSSYYRALRVKLALASGDWQSLSGFVGEEWTQRSDRTANELLHAAQLAARLNLPIARDLTREVAKRAPNDPDILVGAYAVATTCGWEGEPEPGGWLRRAVELSGEDGPLRPMSLQDIVNQAPDWVQQESRALRELEQGHAPMFVTAHALNRSLVRFTLLPALSNSQEEDPRQRSIIPAYSGAREPVSLRRGGEMGVDPSALFTLGFLGVLDKALALFDRPYVPHSTLAWLLFERCEVAFHQPSRIRDAARLRDLMASGRIRRSPSTHLSSAALVNEVGEELASLVAEATGGAANGVRQHLVVRSSPVYRMGSLLREEECDLSQYANTLTGCGAVVEKLRELGYLRNADATQAMAYLSLHERPWPDQPEVNADAILYLDGLSVTYFTHLNLLEVLASSTFTVVVAETVAGRGEQLLHYATTSKSVVDVIDLIRNTLREGIASGRIAVTQAQRPGDQPGERLPEHPSLGLGTLASQCGRILVDDRFLNRHRKFVAGDCEVQVFDTIDVIKALGREGIVDRGEERDLYTRLRRAGYAFVPVDSEEVREYLEGCPVVSGQVRETAELRAVRESLLCARMSRHLRGREDVQWLRRTAVEFVRALKGLWREAAEEQETWVRAEWILEQIDVRRWGQCLCDSGPDGGRRAYAELVAALASAPTESSEETQRRYREWFEVACLGAIQAGDPEMYSWIVDLHRRAIEDVVGKRVDAGWLDG